MPSRGASTPRQATAAESTPAVVWLRPAQAPSARALAEALNLRWVAAGAPGRGQSAAVAAELGCDARDDLRATLAECAEPLALLMDPGEFGLDLAGDARALRAAAARRVKVATLEPIPAAALELSALGVHDAEGPGPAELARFVPLPRAGKVWRDCEELLRQFGPVRTAAIGCFGGAAGGDGSLGAQLYGAVDWLLAIMGEPETVDASFGSPAQADGLHTLPGETLRGLSGDLTANVRFSGGRTACLAVSDQGGRFNRVATLLGKAGRVRVFDDGFEWIDPRGEKVDEQRHSKRGLTTDHGPAALADAVRAVLDPGAAVVSPTNLVGVLSTAQAMLLSTRTGQAESPETIKRMLGRT